MKHIGLFEGIGGFSLAAKWIGWETIAWCEWNEFCQKILSYHFPKAKQHGDITKTDFSIYRGQCDILTGGFPCQPYSMAGKRKGKEDDRHLWPEMLRAIREIQPHWVIGENVHGLINWNGGLVFDEVQTDLEVEGYEVWPYVLPACAVNAPHRRDRVWFVAYSASNAGQKQYGGMGCETGKNTKEIGCQILNADKSNGKTGIAPDPESRRFQERNAEQLGESEKNQNDFKLSSVREWKDFPTQPPVRIRDDGVSSRLDGITFPKWASESIKAAGNAIVPQVAYQLYRVIELIENPCQQSKK